MCGIYASFGSLGFKNEKKNHLEHRGPDDTVSTQDLINGKIYLDFTFYRLEINGVNDEISQQPFHENKVYLMCNGEIFNHKLLAEEFNSPYFRSDCRIILYLYFLFNGDFNKVVEKLDGDFVIVLFDYSNNQPKIFVSRDKFGVRPLFYLDCPNSSISFASESKALLHLQGEIYPFPPNQTREYHINENIIKLKRIYKPPALVVKEYIPCKKDIHSSCIRDLLYQAISKRVSNRDSDIGIGFLLSGGLDSSLVCGIANKLKKEKTKIKTFSIGIIQDNQEKPTRDQNPDLFYARQVADFIGSEHYEFIVKSSEALDAIPEVIYTLETYDTTTIRASVPMYLLSKYIKSRFPHIKVLLSGEGADELFGGYLYFRNAPTPKDFKDETMYLLDNLYRYDVLRADRTVSRFGLELRVPFLDCLLTKYVIEEVSPEYLIHALPEKHEKWLLRRSFENEKIIPYQVLYRQKDAFSDAVGYNWKNEIKNHVDKIEINECRTKEEEWYFQIYNRHYKDKIKLDVPLEDYYWHPKWQPKSLIDPSAKELTLI